MLLPLLMTSWLALPAVAAPQNLNEASPQVDQGTEYLDEVRIVESRPKDGEIELVDAQGHRRLIREGDILEEAGGAKVKDIGRSTLVLTRVAEGVDDPASESLVVVRFDASGKTRVREYRKRPDVTLSEPRPSND